MDAASKETFKKAFLSDICIDNTVVVPSDAAVDEETVVLTIRLFNKELLPIFDATADICIEIKDPDGDILRPMVEDFTERDGTYKVPFVAPRAGKYAAHVLINGKCINTSGYTFYAQGQYSYNRRKHSFKSSPRLAAGNMSTRTSSRMTTGMLTSTSSPRLSTIMSRRSLPSDDILFRESARSRGLVMVGPPSRLTVLDESVQQYLSPRLTERKTSNNLSPRTYPDTITEKKLLYNDVKCISIAFDAAVSHPSVEVSRDSLTISLRTTKQLYGSSPKHKGPRRLRRYPGTIGTRSFSKPGLFYWEVEVKFKILRLIRRTVLFEFGLARADVLDKSFANDRTPYAWVLTGSGCHLCGKVCLHGWHNGQMLSHTPFSDRVPSNLKAHSKLYLGCLLDSSKREWIIVDLRTRKIVAHFKNLLISEAKEPLWPVFAMYNPEQASISLEICYGSEIVGIPEEALDALSI